MLKFNREHWNIYNCLQLLPQKSWYVTTVCVQLTIVQDNKGLMIWILDLCNTFMYCDSLVYWPNCILVEF